MPAINVARTDTFEQQRVKINEISEQIFSINAGGSDLQTGILKLGDGSVDNPALSFTSDNQLGFYRVDNSVLGFVAAGKKLTNLSPEAFVSFKDIITQKNVVGELVITNSGLNYDPGNYSNIPITGGIGNNLTANITVSEYKGNITSEGSGYDFGTYNDQYLEGGNGTGAVCSFTVKGVDGAITDGGSGYYPGTYENVPFTNISSSGSGETATVTVTGEVDYNGSITNAGSGYSEGTYNGVAFFNSPQQTFVVTTVSNPGSPPPANVYQIDGTTQQALTLTAGNTYRFDYSDSSNDGHPLVFKNTNDTALDPGAFVTQNGTGFVDLIIKPGAPTGDIKYDCSIHAGMGATITVQTGTVGEHGDGLLCDATVDSNGNVTTINVLNVGEDYNPNDVLELNLANGTGFEYTLGATTTYTGVVTSIDTNENGLGYLQNDVLSIDQADLGNVGGSGFEFTVTSIPGVVSEFSFSIQGTGYQPGDTLILPDETTGVQGTVFGSITVESTFTEGSTTATVTSTAQLIDGMEISGSTSVDPGTTITVVNATTITLSAAATASESSSPTEYSTSQGADQIQVTSTTGLFPGMSVTQTAGNATLFDGATITEIDYATNTLTMSDDSEEPGSATMTFTPEYGANPTTDFTYVVGDLGPITGLAINNPGNGYEQFDVLSVNPTNLVSPTVYAVRVVDIQKLTFTTAITPGTFSVGDRVTLDGNDVFEVVLVKESGGTFNYIIVEGSNFSTDGGQEIERVTDGSTFITDTVVESHRFTINNQFEPSITLDAGSSYVFDLADSTNQSHEFALSKFPDGPYSPSRVTKIVNITAGSNQITVDDTSSIAEGMVITVLAGQGVVNGTTVTSVVDGTTLEISQNALVTGETQLEFRGVEYTDGVTRDSSFLTINVTSSTPTPLYYYCRTESIHENMGGFDGDEVAITVNQGATRTYGSGATFVAATINTEDSIYADVETGTITLSTLNATEINSTDYTGTNLVTSPFVEGSTYVKTPQVRDSGSGLSIQTINANFTGNINITDKAVITGATGNILSQGEIKVIDKFNSNDRLQIKNNIISTTSNDNVVVQPYSDRLLKVDASTGFVVPKGTDSQRPTQYAENGAIRFNTDSNQYEGYSDISGSGVWSSLGGVRDLDGNTYIKAEASPGANDNTLYYYNDDILAFRNTKNNVILDGAKTIQSSNTVGVTYSNWVANLAVFTGNYLRYRNNVYEVMLSGTTGTSGNPPVDVSGDNFTNGTATLRWIQLAVGEIVIDEVSQVRIGPFGDIPVVIGGDLRLKNNVISTDINDVVIQPLAGKKVKIDATTSIAVPVGDVNQRGSAIQGSLRFNTSASQFEGYDGANWGSLGGVKDVDQDTQIKAESSAGSDEDTLTFFNEGILTLTLNKNQLSFENIDVVRSVVSDEFELTASLLTLDNAATTLDNTTADTTFLHTSKQYFKIGLSGGINVDPVLTLSNDGDLFYNTAFGTGTPSNIKLFDADLKTFETTDLRVKTEDAVLTKGTVDSAVFNIYETATNKGAKIVLIAENTNDNEKEFIEFGVTDDGADVFFTEYGNIQTNGALFTPVFELTAGVVRLNITVGATVGNTQTVNLTIVSHITKK